MTHLSSNDSLNQKSQMPTNILLEKWADVGFVWSGQVAICEFSRLYQVLDKTQTQPNLTIQLTLTKKEGMGTGDFKLLGALGAWVGVGLLPLIILLSAVFGSIVGLILMRLSGESKPFAFGPYIALGGIIALLWGNDIMQWYL